VRPILANERTPANQDLENTAKIEESEVCTFGI
jgi:hypothetical protein